MLPRALQFIPSQDLDLFNILKKIISALPDVTFGKRPDNTDIPISCHLLTRALAFIFPTLEVCDGIIDPDYPHSWLMTESGRIIDPYLIGAVGGPIIFDNELVWRNFYGRQCCFPDHQKEPFTSQALLLSQTVQEVYKELRGRGEVK